MPASSTTKITKFAAIKPYARTRAPKTKDSASKPSATSAGERTAALEDLKESWSEEELKVQGVPYPTNVLERARFRLDNGKVVSAHQWKVYDTILRIPVGKVTTYGMIAKALGSAAQAVGGALRDNPFPPYIPCHRVIASDLFIGGFQGEWVAPSAESGKPKTLKRSRKLALLEKEGVAIDERGYLVGGEDVLWKP